MTNNRNLPAPGGPERIRDEGGQAFPIAITRDPEGGIFDPRYFGGEGMTLRDYFAAAAMQGQLSNAALLGRFGLGLEKKSVAEFAYQQADAMLKERDK